MPAWYYAANNQPVGPVDEATMRKLVASGQITRATLVWREGMANWMSARDAGLISGPPAAPQPPENEFAMMLAACRGAAGPSPRNWRLTPYLQLVPPAWLQKRPKDPLWEVFRQQERLYREGTIVWGTIVQANSLLFSPGNGDCPASVIYSPDPAFDNHPHVLEQIAHSLFAVKGTAQRDPELAEFSRMLANEMDRALRLAVPRSLTGGRAAYHTAIMVPRKHLPHGYLTGGLFPLLIHPQVTAGTILLPSQFWPEALLGLWTPHAR